MRTIKQVALFFTFFLITNVFVLIPLETGAQSYRNWYNNAQERIDTLRKGTFGIKVVDKNGQPFSGEVSVNIAKHAFPFGIAFDFYEGEFSMGNSYSTGSSIQAPADNEIYQTERWNDYLAYSIPIESGKEYKLTLKFAEIYADAGNFRLFDVKVEGELFLDDYDVFTEAGGKNIAKDTSITFVATDNVLNIELKAEKDNAMIKGIVLEEITSSTIIRINCGGAALTTEDGNTYVTEEGYFDPDANTVATEEQWKKAAMYKYFNYGACGNSFKWSGIQPQPTAPDYTNFENAVRWTQKVGWELRAHTLLWGGEDDHSMPGWVRNLPTPRAITDTCKMRVIREVTRYKGIIKEYDVINEPLTGHADHLRNTVGDSILWNCFKWARSADPDAELYINDYNVEYNWGQALEYRDLILQIKEMGGPVTGVGIQAHFWDGLRPNVNEVVRNLNIIAEAGLPMRLTEFDWGSDLTQKQQVEDFVKVATIAFSHPSVNGMICWALCDNGAWRDNSGFFDANYKPKLAADTLLYYTKTKWATNFDSVMAGGNEIVFDAYYGDYTIEADFDGVTKVFTVPFLEENEDSVFTLFEADAVVKGPQFVKAELHESNAVKITFDKEIESGSLTRSDFKFFSNNEIGLEAVQKDDSNPKAVILSLSANVNTNGYASVSYFPGTLKATDGSIAVAFGPEKVVFPVSNDESGSLVANGIKLYPNPATSHLTIVNKNGPFKMKMYDSTGRQVYGENSQGNKLFFDVSSFRRGIYLIGISCTDNQVYMQKILLK
ncbi:MAG: endo-1,4-beta-xylanase [Prolixibacteraceae bacterium]|nr:endo-1,4-beta-xylanase [Prolixibacteraceae bacterium]